ncbi:MAG TPA: riboflavin kinase, partial [Tepidisphaeraceae bacterium]
VLDLTAEQFWQILRDDVRPAAMVEGLSFSFGKGRGGNIQRLREWTANSAVALHIVEPVTAVLTNLSVVPVSSSTIRWLLGHGRMRDAAICLGRPYLLEGTVVEGQGRGRTLGVPTANLQHADQLAPADGVYAARCAVAGKSYAVALSIGTNPTFADGRRQVEAHLIGFDGNLYGAILGIELVDWLRDQRKFPDVEALKRQIARDLNAVIVSASRQPQREIALAQI